MSLIKWNPETSFFPSFSHWMDDFFQDNSFKPMVKGVSIPAVNVTESKDAYNLNVAVPGFRKDDFKLEVRNGYITISGESRKSEEEQEETFTRREYAFNSFSRSFSLPENILPEAISAQYADGILKVTLPKKKAEEKPGKQITVD
ncbi:MAG TPA: Hsp20/alpha crystallin family protein [Saprospiraceae bacterium]|nr:Hsp20/alpha crystallin family protein [Saprospiraceae bacterium]